MPLRMIGILTQNHDSNGLRMCPSCEFENVLLARLELNLARAVARLGREAANKARNPDPWDDLALPEGLDLAIIDDSVTTTGGGVGRGGRGANTPEILPQYRELVGSARGRGGFQPQVPQSSAPPDPPGSNNWVVSGRLSATGKPVVVNDPHRAVTHPSRSSSVSCSTA